MRKGFTLIELMIVVAIIAVIAAIAIPNLMSSRMASNESACIAGLRAFLGAQSTFRRVNRYEKDPAELVYANTDDSTGSGYPDLFEVHYAGAPTADAIKLIDLAFANADADGQARDKAGYVFQDIDSQAIGGAYDYSSDCGLSGMPSQYNRTGLHIFVVDLTGTVYKKEASSVEAIATGDAVTSITEYPDTTTDNWIAVSE